MGNTWEAVKEAIKEELPASTFHLWIEPFQAEEGLGFLRAASWQRSSYLVMGPRRGYGFGSASPRATKDLPINEIALLDN